MFKNYLKIAFRNIVRYKGYSFINIFGLTIGLTCCIFIFLYVNHEVSYDRYHKGYERIFRISEDVRTENTNRVFALTPFPLIPAITDSFPAVEYGGRFARLGARLVKNKEADVAFYENDLYIADQDILNIFSIGFLMGNPGQALVRPNTLVITEKIAEKYFGKQEALGKLLDINGQNYEVTGIVENPPPNTHWKYKFLLSLKTYESYGAMTNWYGTMTYSYVKLVPKADIDAFSAQIQHIADKYIGEVLKNRGEVYRFFLQPISDIHLSSSLRYEIEPPGNSQMITVFFTVGLLVLLIACINFINLSTAHSANRAREVGIRKVVGGHRKQLILQFLGESFIVSFLSLITAIMIVSFGIPFFNNLLGIHLPVSSLLHPTMIVIMLGLLFFTGLGAGLYPSFILAGFEPTLVLKASNSTSSTKSVLRVVLVLFQFTISIVLLIMTFGVNNQLSFMKNQYLGFDKEQKLVIPFQGGNSIENTYESVKTQYLWHSNVLDVTASSSVLGHEMANYSVELVGESNNMNQSMFHLAFDTDFIPNFNIKMLTGRSFDHTMGMDEGNTCLINRSAMKALGINSPEEALDKTVNSGRGGLNLKIIGVTEDFHYRGLQHKVEPLIMFWFPRDFRNIILTLNTSKLSETLAFAKNEWETLYPGAPFTYYFLDEDFNRQYISEERTSHLFNIFTILGLLIACFGLLGLVAFMTRQRIKEVGVRKALGASVTGIFILISKEFIKWVFLANIIAWPLAYIAINRWLSNFSYRTSIGIWSFILSTLLVLLISMLTVSYQSFRAAVANPVDSLRYE